MAFTMIPLKNEDENFCGAEFSFTGGAAVSEFGADYQNLTFNAFGEESQPSMVMGTGGAGKGIASTSIQIDSDLSISFMVFDLPDAQNPALHNASVSVVALSKGEPIFTKSYYLKHRDVNGNWVDTAESGVYVGSDFSISMPNRLGSPYLATFQHTGVHTVKVKVAASLAADGSGHVNATAKVDFPEEDKAADFTTRELNAIDAAMREHEGITDHMYLDTNGYVTVGIGFMLPNEAAAVEYPFLTSNNSPASVEQKRAEWQTIHALPTNYVAGWYQSHTDLHLASDYIDSRLGAIISTNFSELNNLFPAIGQYPGAARVALQDMIYNVGATRLSTRFPRFMEAVRNQDWATAATESHRNIPDESRNDAVRDLFLNAAGTGDF
ncbi:MAG TPA: hypothetical protein DDZ74_00880 [Pseudomonas sp.]|uniref:hypothetical protein n=1 Tax=unclassified Pseudomonas TaxID=196821 RepID=UPI000CE5DAF1|nr:hypothetical protein [Pseudomonas sp. SWI36]AVD91109.1 hypothetical protein C4Q27_00975 [Pseudomonas sp. SWI36]HBK47926.1 hypothetical protein [Pseudomonas sp.]